MDIYIYIYVYTHTHTHTYHTHTHTHHTPHTTHHKHTHHTHTAHTHSFISFGTGDTYRNQEQFINNSWAAQAKCLFFYCISSSGSGRIGSGKENTLIALLVL